jgi:hypothetical protein
MNTQFEVVINETHKFKAIIRFVQLFLILPIVLLNQ